MPTDQAAAIEFNEDGRVPQRLTGREALLREARSGIRVRRQTRIGLGIELAHDELMGDRHKPGNQRLTIVLTDGRANPPSADVAVARAAAAKDDDILVFTIGLGEDLDLWALEEMASQPSCFHRAPDAEDLGSIHRTIAAEIPCPAESFWGCRLPPSAA